MDRPPRTRAETPGASRGRLLADRGDQDGRPVRRFAAGLAVGEVHAHDGHAGRGGRLIDGHEGGGVPVRAGAGGEQDPERPPGPAGAHTTARRRFRRAVASSAMTCSSQPASMDSDSVRAWVMMRNHCTSSSPSGGGPAAS